MKMLQITCKNHPDLRWQVKEAGWDKEGYNGQRHLHFLGQVIEPDPTYGFARYKIVRECDCSATLLVLAPEQHDDQN